MTSRTVPARGSVAVCLGLLFVSYFSHEQPWTDPHLPVLPKLQNVAESPWPCETEYICLKPSMELMAPSGIIELCLKGDGHPWD